MWTPLHTSFCLVVINQENQGKKSINTCSIERINFDWSLDENEETSTCVKFCEICGHMYNYNEMGQWLFF